MKKNILIIAIIIIILIILIPQIKEQIKIAMTPEKILFLGDRVDEYSVDFTRRVKDQKKISEFEKVFEEMDFEKELEVNESASDVVTYIMHTKEGIYTHWFDLWLDPENGMALKSQRDDFKGTELTKEQVKILREIIDE